MKNDIIIFNFKGETVKIIIDENNKIWFIAADVWKCLNIGPINWALSELNNTNEIKIITLIDVTGNKRETTLIDIMGAYGFTFLAEAISGLRFRYWISEEVLLPNQINYKKGIKWEN